MPPAFRSNWFSAPIFPIAKRKKKFRGADHGTGLKPSLALGGLSNVWGAAMLPYRDEDISDWPIKNSDLTQHYRAVTEITGLAAQRDDLEEIFPLHCENLGNTSIKPPGESAFRKSKTAS